jgi:hypothetical protein
MPKPIIIGLIVTGAVVVVGAGTFIVYNATKGASSVAGTDETSISQSSQIALVDPDGVYDFFSDPSVTKYPEKDAVFGNGQTLTFEYDGTKTNNDPYTTLSYYPYYIQDDGTVQPLGGGNIEGRGSGTFTVSNSVFNSSAKDRHGFLEIIGTYDAGVDANGAASGKNVTLGMYPIVFDVAE